MPKFRHFSMRHFSFRWLGPIGAGSTGGLLPWIRRRRRF